MTNEDENNKAIDPENLVVEKPDKNQSDSAPLRSEISTSRKHSMDYFTVDGVSLRTGYQDKRYWYLLPY